MKATYRRKRIRERGQQSQWRNPSQIRGSLRVTIMVSFGFHWLMNPLSLYVFSASRLSPSLHLSILFLQKNKKQKTYLLTDLAVRQLRKAGFPVVGDGWWWWWPWDVTVTLSLSVSLLILLSFCIKLNGFFLKLNGVVSSVCFHMPRIFRQKWQNTIFGKKLLVFYHCLRNN